MKIMLLLICLLTSPVFINAQKSTDIRLIRENYELYTKALLTFDGKSAVDYVTQNTIDYYGRINELVKHGDSLTVAKLPLMDRFMVFRIRHQMSLESLSFYSGRELLIYAITSGLIGKNSARDIVLDKISVKGNEAVAGAKKGKEIAGRFYFKKENNKWRMNLVPLIDETSTYLSSDLKKRAVKENDFIHELIQSVNELPVDKGIYWLPSEKSRLY